MGPALDRVDSERLILRPLRLDDAPHVQELASPREIAATTLRIPHPYPTGGAESFIRSLLEPGNESRDRVFGIVLRERDLLIGVIGLHLSLEHEHAELGYWVGLPYWSKGYCTEAAKQMLRFGFVDLRLHRIYAHHFANNPASGRVMEKLGMRYEGTLVQHIKKWGLFVDLRCYGIVREQWEAGQSSSAPRAD